MNIFGFLFRVLFRRDPQTKPIGQRSENADDAVILPSPDAVRAEARPIAPEPEIVEHGPPTLPSQPVVSVSVAQPIPDPVAPPEPQPEPQASPTPTLAASGQSVSGVIQLGSVDADVPDSAWSTFINALQSIGRVDFDKIVDGLDKIALNRLAPVTAGVMTVVQLQAALRHLGFYVGGEVDGICGYRTSAAIRLFQEYVRTMEGQANFRPDGQFGPASNAQLQRWLSEDLRPDWQGRLGEYEKWLSFLGQVQAKVQSSPTAVDLAVNAFSGPSDTRKIDEWDITGPGNIHLIGVRRSEYDKRFDDVFVLLLDGMVFKFQGSTEPGQSDHAHGPPYLVPGQHDYHFGWHRKSYHALRPLSTGVLIIRGGDNFQLDDSDLDKGLQANASINIHWAGKGLARGVGSWSEGCQVITGGLYINPRGELIDCSDFTAINNTAFNQSASMTRGAYTLLCDLIAAYSGDMGSNKVLYTMISEDDLDLDAEINADLTAARDAVYARST